jgi:hypothetical protein
MSRVRSLAAGSLLGIGLFVSVLTGSSVIDRTTPPAARNQFTAGFVLFGLIPIALGTWLTFKGREDDAQAEQQRLQGVFYRLLKEGKGQINVLRFSIEANINGTDAKAFLDDRAREFNAAFNVTEDGKIFYYFDGDFTALPAATSFDLILESYPWRERDTLANLIQYQMSLERRTARAIVKQARAFPVTIARGISQSRANSLKDKLEAVGAKVLIIARE